MKEKVYVVAFDTVCEGEQCWNEEDGTPMYFTKAESEAKQLPLMPLTPRQPSPIGWQIRQTSFKHNQSVIFPTAGNSTQGYEFPACNFSYPYYCSCVI